MTAALKLDLQAKQDWTVDDLASLPKDLRYELINGRLILPSPTPFHQFIGHRIVSALEVGWSEEFFISSDQSVVVSTSNGRYSEPRPDVVVIRAEGANRTPVTSADVLLAVEVVSPESTIRDRRDKAEIYAAEGIATYWVIDPLAPQITFSEFLLGDDGRYHRNLETDGLVTIDRPWETTLDLPEWTRRRDWLRAKARPKE
jgi:Uma2 family endonuclease